ncbi:hypothetical protein [Bradyrhizobium sp. 191]|uniref:hypothetical protein n=1 Tax=Bradyrhizobium sp. 191 TaxID=2782659 RepID=UPI001FFE98A8|nr:hypothetical protein [Bradyrhizobium sp. 191]UPJ64281.1 hypothetical protein IVB23_30575 [Bradyrhizobium sp. 191]
MINKDDVIKAPRQLEPLTYTFGGVITTHAETSIYRVSPRVPAQQQSKRKRFHHNNSLWEALIDKRLTHGSPIDLESFFIFEWFPRSPGLYWTERGRQARAQAKARVIEINKGSVIYDPHGKQSMLDGGIGNIRLGPILIGSQQWILMSASSNGNCHEGFPIAISSALFREIFDEIRSRGACVRTISGQLRMIPSQLSEVYHGYTGVPKFYLEVEDLTAPREQKSRSMEELEVSLAVSFKGTVNGKDGIYAAYVTHDPSSKKSFDEQIGWMRDKYVRAYNGTILTDFDEQENHFPEARFSLKKVMSLQLTSGDFEGAGINLNVQRLISIQKFVQKESNYTVEGGSIAALGDSARATNFTQSASNASPSPRKAAKKSTRKKN